MKKITLILLVILMALTVTSCSKDKTDAPAGMKDVSNDSSDYQLFVPEEWVVDRSDRGMIMVHVPDVNVADGVAQSNFSVVHQEFPFDNEEYQSIEDYYEKYIEKDYLELIKDNFSDVEVVEDFVECEVDSKKARSVVFTATVGELQYKFKQVTTVDNTDGIIYIFTYTSSLDDYDKHLKSVDKIIEEFRFL